MINGRSSCVIFVRLAVFCIFDSQATSYSVLETLVAACLPGCCMLVWLLRVCLVVACLCCVDIKEDDKPGGPEGEQMLGKRLSFHGLVFEDLDEICARYIMPISTLIEDIKAHG